MLPILASLAALAALTVARRYGPRPASPRPPRGRRAR